jgi:hypothetical protein
MVEPIVAGAFFRALRLGDELHRRGWRVVVCNGGPGLDDPKITDAADWLKYVPVSARDLGYDPRAACRQLQDLDPDVVIMGEGPFDAMRVSHDGANSPASRSSCWTSTTRPCCCPTITGWIWCCSTG